jgi:hypothetical protein
MPQVSGGGVYSDLQQAIRRQRGDPNGQRDPVERALPWLTLGLALAAVIAIVVVNATGGEDAERDIDPAQAGAAALAGAAEQAGFEVLDQDARTSSAVGAEAMVVVASDDEEVAVSWMEPPVDDLLFETFEDLGVDNAVISVGEGGDRLPRAAIDCERSTLMVSGRLGLEADPRARPHRDPEGLEPDVIVEVARELTAALDCPRGLPTSEAWVNWTNT